MALKFVHLEHVSVLGEGPHWDVETQSLYYIDFVNPQIHRYEPSTGKRTTASTDGKKISLIIPVEGQKGKFVVAMGRDIVLISWNGEDGNINIIETIPVENNPEASFNDGKCDAKGRLWAGTLSTIKSQNDDPFDLPRTGSLYSLDNDKKIKKHLTTLGIANGLDWDTKKNKFYYIDSCKYILERFDYDVETGTISNGVCWFSMKKHNIPGLMDGMTIDSDGNLWVAIFNGPGVIKIDGNQSEKLLETITLPGKQITSLAFGGPNLDHLYVTTGKFDYDGNQNFTNEDGCLFRIENTGVQGLPANNFKLN